MYDSDQIKTINMLWKKTFTIASLAEFKCIEDEPEDRMKLFRPDSEPLSSGQMTSIFCKLAVPAVCTNVLGVVTLIVNAVFAGWMNDPAKLAAVGLSNVVVAMMMQSLLKGLNSA